MKLNEDRYAILNFYDDCKNGKIKGKINECWYQNKGKFSDEDINKFCAMRDFPPDSNFYELGNYFCGDILEKDEELYNGFLELGIKNKESMKYFIINEWHKEAQESHKILDNENKLKKYEALKEPIISLWADLKESMFVEKDTLSNFINTRVGELYTYHFGLGTYLRNTFLKPNSELYQKFIELGTIQPDDMSSVMIRIWHNELRMNKISE